MKIKRNLWMDRIITPIMIFMYDNDLKSFVTLNTLKVLKSLMVLKAETALFPPPPRNICSTRESTTIPQSKIFILSLA